MRDRVYALLGLTRGTTSITVDYDRSVWHVFLSLLVDDMGSVIHPGTIPMFATFFGLRPEEAGETDDHLSFKEDDPLNLALDHIYTDRNKRRVSIGDGNDHTLLVWKDLEGFATQEFEFLLSPVYWLQLLDRYGISNDLLSRNGRHHICRCMRCVQPHRAVAGNGELPRLEDCSSAEAGPQLRLEICKGQLNTKSRPELDSIFIDLIFANGVYRETLLGFHQSTSDSDSEPSDYSHPLSYHDHFVADTWTPEIDEDLDTNVKWPIAVILNFFRHNAILKKCAEGTAATTEDCVRADIHPT